MAGSKEDERINFEVIDKPDLLDAQACDKMADEWLSLSLQAFSGDQAFGPEFKRTWREIFRSELDRPGNCDRIVLARNSASQLVSFLTSRRYEIERYPVMYCSFAVTAPDYRRAFVTKRASDHLLSEDYIRNFSGGYLVGKTANPTAYLFGRHSVEQVARMLGVDARLHPRIGSGGTLAAVPEVEQRMARLILAEAGGLERFESSTFIVRGEPSRNRTLYHDYRFRCSDAGVAAFFNQKVDTAAGDSLFVIANLS